ncbi:MAG: hypothetical protein LBK26_02100 [Rickettsiales bacterium]|nr:hypothetical protein [Rickettsiales bacterium]
MNNNWNYAKLRFLSVLLAASSVIAMVLTACGPDDIIEPLEPVKQPVANTLHLHMNSADDFHINTGIASDSVNANPKKRVMAEVGRDIIVPDSAKFENLVEWNLFNSAKDSVSIDWKNYGVTSGGNDTLVLNPARYEQGGNPLIKSTVFSRNETDSAALRGLGVDANLIRVLRAPVIKEPPVDQKPGDYHLQSGSDIANILAGITQDKEKGAASKITIDPSSGTVVIYADQSEELALLLALKSDPDVTFAGELVIDAGNPRVVMVDAVIAALKEFGGKISQSGTNAFHIPVIADTDGLRSILSDGAYVSTNRGENFENIAIAKPDTTRLQAYEIDNLSEYLSQIPTRTDGKRNVIEPEDTRFKFNNDNDLLKFGQPSVPATKDNPYPQFYMTKNPYIVKLVITAWTDSIGTAVKQRFVDNPYGIAAVVVKNGLEKLPFEVYTDANHQLHIDGKNLIAIQTHSLPSTGLHDENYSTSFKLEIDIDKYLVVSSPEQEAELFTEIGSIIMQVNNNSIMKDNLEQYSQGRLNKEYRDRNGTPALVRDMWGQKVVMSFNWMVWSDFAKTGKIVR